MLKETIRDGVNGMLRAVEDVVSVEMQRQGIPESTFITQRVVTIDAEPGQPPTTVLEFAAALPETNWIVEPFLQVKVEAWMDEGNLVFAAEAPWHKDIRGMNHAA